MAFACGFAAGVVAVIVRRKKAPRGRFIFYTFIALSAPVGAAVVFAIEVIRAHRMEAVGKALGFPVESAFSNIPFWVISLGFGLSFLALLRKEDTHKASEPTHFVRDSS